MNFAGTLMLMRVETDREVVVYKKKLTKSVKLNKKQQKKLMKRLTKRRKK